MRLSSSTRRLLTAAAVVVGLTVASGCTRLPAPDPVARDSAPQTPAQRARQVAEAWDGSAAAAAWRAGYHPTGPVARPPHGGWHSSADETAYRDRDLVLRDPLPTAGPKHGRVTWGDEVPLRRPLRGAEDSYEALARGHDREGPHLTVTGARLGEMRVATGRGPAVVPAWLFHLEGYDAPLKRAAAVPSDPPRSPIGRMTGAAGIDALVRADGRSVTVVVSHGACDEGLDVDAYETPGSVVLFVDVKRPRDDGLCTKQAVSQRATVQLDHPLDDRVLLDAMSGRPVRCRPWYARSSLSGS